MKGKRIYLVCVNGTLDEGAMAFENYKDALQYAEDKLDEFKQDVDATDIDDLKGQILEQEDVKEGNEPVSKTPFRARIDADNYEGDYIKIQIVKETIH